MNSISSPSFYSSPIAKKNAANNLKVETPASSGILFSGKNGRKDDDDHFSATDEGFRRKMEMSAAMNRFLGRAALIGILLAIGWPVLQNLGNQIKINGEPLSEPVGQTYNNQNTTINPAPASPNDPIEDKTMVAVGQNGEGQPIYEVKGRLDVYEIGDVGKTYTITALSADGSWETHRFALATESPELEAQFEQLDGHIVKAQGGAPEKQVVGDRPIWRFEATSVVAD